MSLKFMKQRLRAAGVGRRVSRSAVKLNGVLDSRFQSLAANAVMDPGQESVFD
jgi:hypothetical protein